MPGSDTGTEDTAVNLRDENLLFRGAYSHGRGWVDCK